MAWSTRRIVVVTLAVTLCVPVGLVARRVYRHLRGIEVCVRNVDTRPLRAGQIAVRENPPTLYPIRDLAPGKASCVYVKVSGEASIDVTFAGGKPIALDGYVEGDNSGSISADVTADGARNIVRDIDLY